MGRSINREKVVKGLTICRHKAISQENCMECPYIYDKRSKQSSCECVLHDDTLKLLKEQEEEIENLKQTAQSMMEGICLLKEQEAVKPINMENDIVYGLSEISLYLSNIGEDDFAQTIEDACKKLELLKEREAVKPIKKDTVEITARYEFDCPCGAPLLIGQPYCADCGKKVKWE